MHEIAVQVVIYELPQLIRALYAHRRHGGFQSCFDVGVRKGSKAQAIISMHASKQISLRCASHKFFAD